MHLSLLQGSCDSLENTLLFYSYDAKLLNCKEMNPKNELEKRYPQADFSRYFAHLAAYKTVKQHGAQEHHICPRAQFPEFILTKEQRLKACSAGGQTVTPARLAALAKARLTLHSKTNQ